MSRLLSALVSGLLLGLLVASWILASANFRQAERLASPGARREVQEKLASVSPEDRRTVFRHFASELNRFLFRSFSAAEASLLLVLFFLVWGSGPAERVLAALALAAALVQVFFLAPGMAALGESIDFLPRPLPSALQGRFALLHGGYVVLDLAKALFVLAMAALSLRRPPA